MPGETATCKKCPFWECNGADRTASLERRCMVRSPAPRTTPTPDGDHPRVAVWPWTRGNEWCGEHPLRQRDRLAAMAMQGLLAGNRQDHVGGEPELRKLVFARIAYEYADAMLAVGQKRNGTG